MANAKAVGEQEALLFVLQIVVGVAAGLIVMSMVADRILADTLGFLAMCGAMWPFARKTWAAEVSAQRYFASVLLGASVAAGLRLVSQ